MDPDNLTPETVETPVTPEAEAPPAEDFVSFESIKPKTPGSRREQAERARAELDELKAWKSKFEGEFGTVKQTYEQRLAEQAERMAHLQGQLEERARQPQQPIVVPPARENPAELRKQARKALTDDKDLDVYEELTAKAARIEAENLFDERAKGLEERFTARIPQTLPPEIQTLVYQNPHVAAAGNRGHELVEIRARELKYRGVKPGPALLAQAFKLANDELAPKVATANTAAAQALTAVPAGRAAGGSTRSTPGAGYTPTAEEKATAARFGMSVQDYVKYKPEFYKE